MRIEILHTRRSIALLAVAVREDAFSVLRAPAHAASRAPVSQLAQPVDSFDILVPQGVVGG